MSTGKRITELLEGTTITDEDVLPYVDIDNTNSTKKISFANFKTSLSYISKPSGSTNGYVLTYLDGQWIAAPSSGSGSGTTTLAGEVQGTSTNNKVVKLFGGVLKPNDSPAYGDILYFDGAYWLPTSLDSIPSTFASFTRGGSGLVGLDAAGAVNYILSTSEPTDSLKIWAGQMVIDASAAKPQTIKCDGTTESTFLSPNAVMPSFDRILCVLVTSGNALVPVFANYTNPSSGSPTITLTTSAGNFGTGTVVNMLILGYKPS